MKYNGSSVGRLGERKRMRSWKVPGGPRLVQIFPSHFMHSPFNVFVEPFSLEKGRQIPLNQSSSTWQAKLRQLKKEIVLAVKASTIEVTRK